MSPDPRLTEIDGEFAADLAFNPDDSAYNGNNSIQGLSGPVRLTKVDIRGGGRCSDKVLSPLYPQAPSTVAIGAMVFNNFKPESVQVSATEFGPKSDSVRGCYEDVCSNEIVYEAPMSPFYKGDKINMAVVKDLPPGPYPILFQCKARGREVKAKISENISEIEIEHTGRHR